MEDGSSMLCERCKVREANIQYTEIVGGVKTEHHFCAQCAKELDFGPYSAIFDSEFPLGKLLSGLLGVGQTQEEEMATHVVCPTCKTSYGEFVKNSQFGCPDCYGVFDLLIGEKIRQLQGNDTHKGKRPKKIQASAHGAFPFGEIPGMTKHVTRSDWKNRPNPEMMDEDDGLPMPDGSRIREDEDERDVYAGSQMQGISPGTVPDAENQKDVRRAEEETRMMQEAQNVRLQAKISQLERRLKEALREEDYESAVLCRDQIRKLKEEIGKC